VCHWLGVMTDAGGDQVGRTPRRSPLGPSLSAFPAEHGSGRGAGIRLVWLPIGTRRVAGMLPSSSVDPDVRDGISQKLAPQRPSFDDVVTDPPRQRPLALAEPRALLHSTSPRSGLSPPVATLRCCAPQPSAERATAPPWKEHLPHLPQQPHTSRVEEGCQGAVQDVATAFISFPDWKGGPTSKKHPPCVRYRRRVQERCLLPPGRRGSPSRFNDFLTGEVGPFPVATCSCASPVRHGLRLGRLWLKVGDSGDPPTPTG
jgi:hypothetical protein